VPGFFQLLRHFTRPVDEQRKADKERPIYSRLDPDLPADSRETNMAKLTTEKKNAEPEKEFGLPKERKYPMPDANHAKNAKARASQMERQGKLSAADKKKIDTKADRILK
jgi:hypothetical protein